MMNKSQNFQKALSDYSKISAKINEMKNAKEHGKMFWEGENINEVIERKKRIQEAIYFVTKEASNIE